MSAARITEVIPKFTVWAEGGESAVQLLVDAIAEHEGVDECAIVDEDEGKFLVHVLMKSNPENSSAYLSLAAFLRHMTVPSPS